MYATQTGTVGTPQLSTFALALDTTSRMPLGTIVSAQDTYWGGAEFIYARANAAITQYAVCVLSAAFNSSENRWRTEASEAPNTANLGQSLAVAMRAMSSGDMGWFMISGVTPVKCNASVAAGTTFGIAAAGQGGANTAGKQILNARVQAAATTTVARNGVADSGSTKLVLTNTADGWFVGAYLSGTGIAAGTTVAAIDPDGRTITLSAATTAAVNGAVTATYNNATIFYNVAQLNRPFAQGAIT